MLTRFLIRTFVKNPDAVNDHAVRYSYGKLAGSAGLGANLILFISKLAVGFFSSSVAIMADAFNNLSDAGSSIVTLVGFKLSSAPPDEKHPFGHGRIEYLSAIAVAALIMIAGFQLGKSAFEKILHPTLPSFGIVAILTLAVAIGVKLWMALFYRKIGVLIQSEALRAATTDSRNDVLCTGIVLLSSIVGWASGVAIDGYVGVAVAIFVVWSGFSVIRDTISPLLGQAPDPVLVQGIRDTVLAHPGIMGIHDLIVHNYGPGRCVVSLHAEVPCREDMMRSHEVIDHVERELKEKYRVVSCIHMDPIDTDNEQVQELREMAERVLEDIDPCLSMHDFRVVFGEKRTNLIFDVIIPFAYPQKTPLEERIEERIQMIDPKLFTVITVENGFL